MMQADAFCARAWVDFIFGRAPSLTNAPAWPRFNLAERPVMVINRKSTVVLDPNAAERHLWDGWPRERRYSSRSASTGGISEARHAGMYEAAAPIRHRLSRTPAYVHASELPRHRESLRAGAR